MDYLEQSIMVLISLEALIDQLLMLWSMGWWLVFSLSLHYYF